MRQKKSFFTKNNTLNKGNPDHKTHDIKPHHKADLLAEYENLKPDSKDTLVEMARKEQEHEHKMEELKYNIMARSRRMGRICALFIIIAICYFTSDLIFFGHPIYGLILAFISFGSLLMLGCKHKCEICNGNNNKPRHYSNHRNESKPQDATADNNHRPRSNRNYHNRYRGKTPSA